MDLVSEVNRSDQDAILELPEIVLWSADFHRTTGQAIVTRQVVEGQTRIRWIPAVYSSSHWRSAPSAIRAAFVLWGALLRRRAREIYVVCSRSNAGFLRDVPALLPVLFGVPVTVHAHGSDIVDLLAGRRISPIARLLYSRCRLIIPSAHLVAQLGEVRLRGVHVCENFLLPVSEEETLPPGNARHELVVLWNSNIMSSKGFFDVAEGVRLAHEEGHNVRLVSLGAPIGDPERTASETLAELDRLARYPWFNYVGRIAPGDAVRQTAAADVVVLPSRYRSECQPLGLIQAMCLAKHIIASDTPALRATLKDYPAVLLPDPEPRAIAEALGAALREKIGADKTPENERRQAAARARDRFSVERFNAQMADLLGQARSEREGRVDGSEWDPSRRS